MDAGANSGEEACYYAERSQRVVHAIEPLASNVAYIKQHYGRHLPNLHTLLGGLGSQSGLVLAERSAIRRCQRNVGCAPSQSAPGHAPGIGLQISGTQHVSKIINATDEVAAGPGAFRVHRIDDLFDAAKGLWRGERLGFAHFDVEGAELDVLNGARATIARDRPVFTTECFVHNHANDTIELLRAIHELGYRSFLVEEQCGARCRAAHTRSAFCTSSLIFTLALGVSESASPACACRNTSRLPQPDQRAARASAIDEAGGHPGRGLLCG